MEQPWSQDETKPWASEGQGVGVLVEWQNKGFHSFGWLSPIHLPRDRDLRQSLHGGDLYVHCNDIQEPRLGAVYTFTLYNDYQGLGAQDCRARSVIRFAVPEQSMTCLKLPAEVKTVPNHLRHSLFYPELEERGVTLRRYLWDDPVKILELWGSPEAMIAAAEELGLLQLDELQVLLSPQIARRQPKESLRQLSEEDAPRVPAKCRWATSLEGGPTLRQRLVELLDLL
ncbi:unnamed protein product [Effrenium voratum]|uniref:Uncharacterized protein n=1 Tax=Effrenium voratum TaxID=2562239 RepID=A0AA36N7Y3_9DINO|nr:unnamed protein product [Effrenium voratum]CAJ1395914.1 unnamed protein product [Effrenium voratum]CAJ1425176.1 unnamed protein product [Effrenium voratum]